MHDVHQIEVPIQDVLQTGPEVHLQGDHQMITTVAADNARRYRDITRVWN